MKRISKRQAQKWANALRSGKFEQTTGALQDTSGYCCLGVACEIFIPKNLQRRDTFGHLIGGLPYEQPCCPEFLRNITDDFGNRIGTYHNFVDLNDSENFSFDMIADLIELVYVHKAL